MTYATQQDMVDRFGQVELAQLTDRAAGSVIDTAVLGRALADADAEIDAYLGSRYTLPLTSLPPVLPRMAADIARYRLYDDRATDSVRERYSDALKTLRDIASGLVKLDAGVTPVPVAPTSVAVVSRTASKQFDASALAGY